MQASKYYRRTMAHYPATALRGSTEQAGAQMKIHLEIYSDTQYATAYCEGKPVATVARRRVYDYNAPAWKAYATDGTLLFEQQRPCVPEYLARRIGKALEARNV